MPESHSNNNNPSEITPELVQEVAKELYKLLLLESRIDRERRRLPSRYRPHRQGGW
jgi:hypothetical protein